MDREGLVGVADGEPLSVDGADGDAPLLLHLRAGVAVDAARAAVQLLALLVDHGDVLAEGVEGRDDHLRGGTQDVEHSLPVPLQQYGSLLHNWFPGSLLGLSYTKDIRTQWSLSLIVTLFQNLQWCHYNHIGF